MKYAIVFKSGAVVTVNHKSEQLAKEITAGVNAAAQHNACVGEDWMVSVSDIALLYPAVACEVKCEGAQ